MKLYNSLKHNQQNAVEAFDPKVPDTITIYSCGPTVYDRTHIGNLASFIYADSLHRGLQLLFPKSTILHVMNITDIDDKTIRRSQAQNADIDPQKALQNVTRHYEAAFMNDLEAIGIDTSGIKFIRATDSIGNMQRLIETLCQAGIAYVRDDGVYFSIEKYQANGKVYGQLIDITIAATGAARIDNDEYDKDSVHDFALWKKQKPNEPAWDFTIQGRDLKGRPGWHIECSAMSVSKLGQPFDIHTGGVDLKFPHHENEIAQSTATLSGNRLANFFFHSEHMLINGQKMSKSLNNFYTLEDVTNRGYDPLAFRLLVLQSHYRNQAHFSWKNLEAAQNRLKGWRAFSDMQWQLEEDGPMTFKAGQTTIKKAIENDLNLPQAITLLDNISDMVKNHEQSLGRSNVVKFLEFADRLFGLKLANSTDLTYQQKSIITNRQSARRILDWSKSDELRAELRDQGIGLRDTAAGTIWFRE